MSIYNEDLAVQSWCLRTYKDNTKVAQLVRKIGLNSIELCAVHVNFDDESTFAGVIKTYRDAGVRIVSLGVEGFGPDEAAARRRFTFAQQAGCKVMSATFSPATFLAALPVAYKLCDEFKINLAIHNHGGYNWLGNGQVLDWVFSFTRPSIGLNMDTGWALDAKQDPVQWADRFASRMYAVHLKDFTFDRAGKVTDVIVGTGNVKLPELLAVLKKNKFAGPTIVEYEGDVNDPVPSLDKCVKAIRAVA